MEVQEASEVDSVVRARLHQFAIKPFEVILVFSGKVKSADDMRLVTENDRAVLSTKARYLWQILGINDLSLQHRLKLFWDIDNQASIYGCSLEEDLLSAAFQNTDACSGGYSHRSFPG